MSAITLENIPKGLHEVLKHNAESHRRSLNNEIIFNLEDAFGIKNRGTNNLLEEAKNMRNKFRFRNNNPLIHSLSLYLSNQSKDSLEFLFEELMLMDI